MADIQSATADIRRGKKKERERETWTKVNFAPGKILSGDKSFENVFMVYTQETDKHRATFGWPPVSDVAAVTKARRESRWNLLGCPKLANRSQPLIRQSSPYSGDMWRTYCCLTFFPIVDTCLNGEDTARQIRAMVRRWRFLASFFASCISSEPRAAHFRPAS